MKKHWYEATYLLETLVMKAAGQDEDGMDLTFTNGPEKLENQKSGSAFKRVMKKAEPKDGVHSDMRKSLGDIFASYLEELQRKRGLVKNLTLIVLTDGIWAGMSEKNEVKQKIV